MKRYQRQVLLPEIGENGQKFLANSKVLVVGAGGLGHPVIQYLAAMGVGYIGIADGDFVTESNLHRQVLFDLNDLGKNKADCLADKMSQRNHDTKFEGLPFFIDKETAVELFAKYDVIVDGTDNFQAKFLINDVCCYLRKPWVYGAISQFEGQISVFWPGKGPCYRCLVSKPPKASIQNCSEAGVVGALPGVFGTIQAIETLKVLMNLHDSNNRLKPLVSQVMYLDFLENESRSLKLQVKSFCPCQAGIFTDEMIQFVPAGPCVVEWNQLIDVREQHEWEAFRIPGSIHWPLSRIERGDFPLSFLAERKVLICKSGPRAEKAWRILKDNGFHHFEYTNRGVYGYQNRKS